jgi:hypothetical protein
VPLLFDKQFYEAVASRHLATLVVLLGAGVLATIAWPLHDWLLRNDAWQYWTPFLDPSKSAWGVVR